MRVCFSNLGCKLNQAEVDALARRFATAGHEVVSSLADADVHVVNSCTVTHMAARDSRKTARRGARLREGLRTVLTGCYATEQAAAAAALAGVDLVVSNDAKERLLDVVEAAFPELTAPAPPTVLPIPYVPLDFGKTRALVKVEDGCDMRCSFCIIPRTRGKQRSREVDEVVAEVAELVASGALEVVVTGVQISSYRASDGRRLPGLTRALLERTSVSRLRLTSIAPWQFDEELLELFLDPRLCRHVHLSLQSGCSATLRRMRRPYTAAGFEELVDRLRDAIPGLAVTTDVIVGFPGESDREFEESLAFVEKLGFSKAHVFPFSPREGTAAATLPGHLPQEIVRERMRRMLEVAQRGERAFRSAHLGCRAEVLWERPKGGRWQGTTDNYLRVFVDSHEDLHNRLLPVRVERILDDGVAGRLL